MFSLFWRSLIRQLKRRPLTSMLLLIGVTVCIYCISVMLGYAAGQYLLATQSNDMSTLTFDPGEASAAQAEDVTTYAAGLSEYGTRNILYFTKKSENEIIVGWDGIDGSMWFPVSTGRFFTQEDQNANSRVIFLSASAQKETGESVQVGAHTYQVIGSDWIVPWNFGAGVSNRSGVRLFDNNSMDTKYYIIPAGCYLKEFQPDQILIHYRQASYTDLTRYARTLAKKFPDSQAYPPNKDSSDLQKEAQIRYLKLGLLLCLIAGLTVLQLMMEWLKVYRKELYVLRICGMTQARCIALAYGHWLILFLLGVGTAVLLHRFSFPLLRDLCADQPPEADVLVISVSVLFLATLCLTLPQTIRMMKGGRSR